MVHSLIVKGDHFQILVADREHGPNVDTTHLWESASGVASITDTPQLIGVPTVRYGGEVHVDVHILDARGKTNDLEGWSLIGDFMIEIMSGQLLFWGPEAENLDTAPWVPCAAGIYHGSAYSYRTSDVDDEFTMDGPDRYRLQLWRNATTQCVPQGGSVRSDGLKENGVAIEYTRH